MSNKKSYYITTPIYYVNDKPHLGHAYTTIACDVLARFKRLDGYEVFFLTGTDEHGQKVQTSAEKAKIEPQEFTDAVSQNFRDLSHILNYSNDDFIRTTEDRHKVAAQALWKQMEESGNIYLDKYAGWYAVRDEAYYAEDELTDGENGQKIAPSGAECEWVEEESYFFKLSDWEDKLLALYKDQPDFIMPDSRRNEVIGFVKGGLQDLSISRTRLKWGVPVPNEDDHVMYVWVDALTNYLTAIGYPDMKADSFQTFWPADVHVVGKDILRFHAVYWPAFLMAAGIELPKQIFAHGWWTIEGQKMSKSLGNAVSPDSLVDLYGVDGTRYFMLREVPFGNDGNYSQDAAFNRINSDLANSLGNLVQRTLSMIFKSCDGKIPEPHDLTRDDQALLLSAQANMINDARVYMDALQFHKALELIINVCNEANIYIDTQAPWTLKKEDPQRMQTVLYVLAEVIRCLGLIMQPVVPESAAKILDQLKVQSGQRTFEFLSPDHVLSPGTVIDKPEGVFPRLEPPEPLDIKIVKGI